MAILISIGFIIASLIAMGVILERRRCRRITEIIEARGGRVLAIKRTLPSSQRRIIRYIGPQGELRQALVDSKGMSDLTDDQPYQDVLRQPFERKKPKTLLDDLQLAAECSKLPGHAAYEAAIKKLAIDSAPSIQISEFPLNQKFAPMLQYLEAAALHVASGDPHLLELSANGSNINIRWSVTGSPPHRMLTIEMAT